MNVTVIFNMTMESEALDEDLPYRAMARLVAGGFDTIEGIAHEESSDLDDPDTEVLHFELAPRHSLSAMRVGGHA